MTPPCCVPRGRSSAFVVYAGSVGLYSSDELAEFKVCGVDLICVQVVDGVEVADKSDGVVALGSVLGVDDYLAFLQLLDISDDVIEALLSFNSILTMP